MRRWRALIVLGTAQFLMVLDTSVMNVSISQLVEDFDTEVTTIQAVITLYALVMAAFMVIGGRQLGNVVQSSVGEEERSEVGGLQFTAQNLGSALGTALIGSILLGALAHAFTTQVEDDPRLSEEARTQTGVALESGISFVTTDQVRSAAAEAGLPPSEVDAVADSYASAQLDGLKAAILATGGVTPAGFLVTPNLPGGGKSRTGARGKTAAPAPSAGPTR
ncbi:MFS family permease [Streptomyces sp. SLBN-8D4]